MTAPLEPPGSPVFPDPTADPTDAPRTAVGAGTDRSDRGGPPPSERDIRPPVAWYWIGAVILVGSVLGAFVLLVTGTIAVINAPQAYPRVSVPGERTVTLTDAGTYFLFGESDEWSGYSSSYSYGTYLDPPDVTVTDGSGAVVTLTPLTSTSSSDYSVNGFRGYPFASFDVPAGGSYTVATAPPVVRDSPNRSGGTGPSGTTPTTRRPTSSYPASTFTASRVAVGRDDGGSNTARLGGAVALGAVGFVLGVVLLIVTAVRRNRSRAALFPKPAALAATSPYGTPYGASPYGGAPYGGGPYGGPPPAGPYGGSAPGGPYGGPPAGAAYGGPPPVGPYGAPPAPPAGDPFRPAPTGPPVGGSPVGPSAPGGSDAGRGDPEAPA